MTFVPENYPKAVREFLLPEGQMMPLDAGMPNEAVETRLTRLEIDDLREGDAPADRNMAEACLAGLWLLHNQLDRSHRLSQEIHTPTGSLWHAIMHRREGDYDNAKYWLRQVGDHPVYAQLRKAAQAEFCPQKPRVTDSTHDFAPLDVMSFVDGDWEPKTFVDLVRAACRNRADLQRPCRRLQMIEWQTLFDYCLARARGE